MEYQGISYMTGAIIVLYNPDENMLGQCLESIAPQVDEICIIDNSSHDETARFHPYGPKVHYEPLRRNVGIAAAQNIGINYFKEKNFDFILFCDQDSTSPQSLVRSLVEGYLKLSAKTDISCIGPMPTNRKTGLPYIYEKCIIDKREESGMKYYVMHSIISSYSLVPISNFTSVGMMDERLFIDFVDQEWCWRAAGKDNKVCILLPETEIEHELGVSSTFMGHNISVSSAFRIYFQTRNLLWLCRKPYVPDYWKKMNLKKIIIKFFYYSIVPKNRLQYCTRMLKGFYDGLTKHL